MATSASEQTLARTTATAIIGIDTLWGGDVMNPSGTGRFIADSWFSDEPLPRAYQHPTAAKLRQSGGVAGKTIDEIVEWVGSDPVRAAAALEANAASDNSRKTLPSRLAPVTDSLTKEN